MNDMIAMAVMTDQVARYYEMRRQRHTGQEARGIRFKRSLRRLAGLFNRP